MQSIRIIIQILGIIITIAGWASGSSIFKVLLLAAIVLAGPFFCGWLCPFGAIQDMMARLRKLLHIKKRTFPSSLNKILSPMRYLLLAVSILLSFDFIFQLFALDPRSNFLAVLSGNAVGIAGWIVIGAFMAISLFFDRPFCRYLCIEGAKYGAFGALRPFTIVRNESSCINCGICNKACPMGIDIQNHNQVRSLQCINCMNCVTKCPSKDTLKFQFIPVKSTKQKIAAAGIIAILLPALSLMIYNNMKNTIPVTPASTVAIEMPVETTTITEETAALLGGNAAGMKDGTYQGSGTGFKGTVTVNVTVKDQTITAIDVVDMNDDTKWFNRAYKGITAAIFETQTVDVDTVSGATYSSTGIKEAVANALINGGGTNVDTVVNDLPQGGSRRH